MTSLIDVIFLLLLFFMLSSTFTRFAEVELASAGSNQGASTDAPVFMSLAANSLRLNGAEKAIQDLGHELEAHRTDASSLNVLVALAGDVTAQRLTDVLVTLRTVPNLNLTVLDAS